MKEKDLPQKRDRESLEKLTHQELVDTVLVCQELISKQNEILERLQSYLGKDSKTSSKPPSSDLLQRPEKPQQEKPAPGRRPGGQKGHQGKTRKGFGRVDRYELLPATKCNYCGSENLEKVGVTEHSQVVAQLVERPIEVVEYRQQCTHCKDCGHKVVAPLPPDVVPGQDLGVSLQAMLGWMSHYGHLSYGKQQEWLREIGGIEVGVGTLQATTRRLSEAVKGSIESLQEWVKKQPQVHVDESPWLLKGLKEWMWIISGEGFALFHAGDTRSRSELESLLGQSFKGVLISDDFSAYNGYRATAQQKCLAHLLRHFKQVEKLKSTNQKELAGVFLTLITESFREHREYRRTGNRSLYDEWVIDFKRRLKEGIEYWKSKAGYAAGLLLKSLMVKSHQWWYFLDHPEVPPDNNNAERPLRLGVTKRKVSGGSRSMDGFRDTARLLTVIQTCRAQGRSVLEFLREALASVTYKLDNLVSLIPAPDYSLFVNP